MPLPSSGAISISQIDTEFKKGKNLGAYKGVKYFTPTNRRGFFASGSNAYLNISDFYSLRSTSPVTPGSWSQSSAGSYTFTVPMFNIMTITIVGGQGGQAGANGLYVNGDNNLQVANYGTSGGQGGNSQFGSSGSYLNANGGGGGPTSGLGGNVGETKSIVFNVDTNSNYFNLYNTGIPVLVGGGGGGGSGGMNKLWKPGTATSSGYYEDWYQSSSGSAGSPGSITISWT